MLSARIGHYFDKPLAPLAKRISVSPNALTVLGFLITFVAAATLPFDLLSGGLLILVGGFFDMLDGIVARANGKRTVFGAFLDSTLDRYSDSLLFLAAAWHFFNVDDLPGVLLTIGALVGALLTSYVRARAEGLGLDCHIGLMERPERIVLLAAGCITGWLYPAMLLLFALGHLTVIQRIFYISRHSRRR